jgi:hypothetical protein
MKVLKSLLVLSIFATLALAAVPQYFSLQGKLRNNVGSLLTGTYTMYFRIYDAPSGGVLIWGPESQSVVVTSGLFTVMLGAQTPINAVFDRPYYVSVAVGTSGNEMSPRLTLGASGYSLNSERLGECRRIRILTTLQPCRTSLGILLLPRASLH